QFGPPITPTDVKAGEGFVGNGLPEKDVFYYHPDHLGSSSYISTLNGQISQHVEYIAFGEVLFEEHSSSFKSPYLFNGKELDRETNLTNFGARYLDMKTSLWLNVDPLAEKHPDFSPYAYCANNPLNLIDPDGRDWILATGNKVYWYGGKYGDKSTLLHTYKATSGHKVTEYTDGSKVKSQNSKYQYIKGNGPTVEGKYKLNLKPEPETAQMKNGEIVSGQGKGIQSLVGMTDPSQPGKSFSSPAWGENRINLIPVDVKQPIENKNTPSKDDDRDLGSFYFHDSTKGESSGCHEIETQFFDDLLKFRSEGNDVLEVKVQYPSKNHSTNGGTEKTKTP
ncbi:RHS repeat-associated core domain-containing protein, partial [Flavobacterium psychrophilum]|uniref:RHS repeat domain-containing protein n=1 Tax=Flavobacterium psychrophilum TaxID=96345 RepID=UPI002BABDAC9|nr:RHS repeat-associated core domain-containing protein [Flavobacterium psychrophilum]